MDARKAIAEKLRAYEAHLSYLRVEVNRFEGAVTALVALSKDLEKEAGNPEKPGEEEDGKPVRGQEGSE